MREINMTVFVPIDRTRSAKIRERGGNTTRMGRQRLSRVLPSLAWDNSLGCYSTEETEHVRRSIAVLYVNIATESAFTYNVKHGNLIAGGVGDELSNAV